MKNVLSIVLALGIGLLAASAHAAEYYVDEQFPLASDKNPGTEAKPFKTIQAGVDTAKPGDTIWVKAGHYDQPVRITKSGIYNWGCDQRPITLSAWKDDRVQLGSWPQPLPVQGEWKPITGTKSWEIKLNQDVPDDMQVLLNGKPVLTFMQDTPPREEKIDFTYQPKALDLCAAYRKSDRTLMFYANGKNPATLGKFEYARNFRCQTFFTIDADCWIIQKLEFSWLTLAMTLGNNCVVEDCFFTHCYNTGIGINGERRMDIIRRCNFHRMGCAISCSAPGISHIIENNLMVDCNWGEDEDIGLSFQADSIYTSRHVGDGGRGATSFKGSTWGMIFADNIISDEYGPSPGWYADCSGAQDCRIIGNAFWNGAWIYNEYNVNDSFIQGNVFYRSDIVSRACTRLNVVENLFYAKGVQWSQHDSGSFRYGYMLLRKNAFVYPEAPGMGYLYDCNAQHGESDYPEAFRQCMVDYNRIWAPQGAVLIDNEGEGKKYTSLEDIRKELGFEMHGQALPYEKDEITPQAAARAMGGGVVTFRIPWGKYSAEARPMLSDPGMEGVWPVLPFSVEESFPPFFWRVADGNYDPRPLGACGCAYIGHHQYWHAACGPDSEKYGCRWYRDVQRKGPEDKVATPNGNHWLVVEGLHPDKMLPQGLGYWTPYLGAAPGAKITVTMKIRGRGLQPTENGTPAVWLQFTDETNQHRRRSFLLGKDDSGTMHRPEYTKGDFEWTEVKETITAPEGAVRMALFFGMLPSTGKIEFDDVDIQTAGEAAPVTAEILPSKVMPQAIKETFYVDLSKVANRALADDVDNDGKGGWTDQGPDADLREFKTGDRRFGGVPFKILEGPKSIVVLKSVNRAKGDLPEKVAIPIGRKFDTLFFLHSAAWFSGFKYVIHYADGKDVTLTVGPSNMRDWTAEPVARFPLEEGTFSTVAQTVKVPRFGRGSVYRMEWSAPPDRRPVEIKSIEFAGDGKCVAVLLGITGILEW